MNYYVKLLICYLIYLAVISLITFILYAIDKSFAKKENHSRIKEKVLLFTAALGGSIGAYFARILVRHKTQKRYFSFIINFSLMLSLIILGVLVTLVAIGN